ncbi:Malectin [Trichinella pseudospiralis]|uniref:Malectin n=1 Tax=Trichinella pseudospiralis TaxID=6337 RepID=A0A0V1K1X0_TRIPS|nr:Malectin [Trichinella pseudospiralis]KRZ24876.1 Malectin [Trichinella pseudospiralis]KRZ41220.1 Malectin [Trichinella pseudospiralis]
MGAFRSVIIFILSILDATFTSYAAGEVIDAINAVYHSNMQKLSKFVGGPAHIDDFGVQYREDPLEGVIGISSDYGKRFIIERVSPSDQILYQTERYHTKSFEYEIRIPEEGDYVLVLKFSEVYFNAPGQKVFDVALNDKVVIKRLDIFSLVGQGVAHDEYVPFRSSSSHFNGKLKIRFIHIGIDNPKVNALYVLRGTVEDVPQLHDADISLEKRSDSIEAVMEEVDHFSDDTLGSSEKYASGPKLQDPYAQQDQSQYLLPFLVILACFFPILYCLCRI